MATGRIILWGLAALPIAFQAFFWLSGDTTAGDLIHSTGEFAARFMLVALAVTPLRMLFPRLRALIWLAQHRRDLGLLAFAYALMHVLMYVIDMQTLANMLAEIGAVGIWTGWLAFVLFIPLALTSSNWAMQALGQGWRRLHRVVYLAAILTLLHWIYVHNNAAGAWAHFLPLALLEVYRVFRRYAGKTARSH